MTTTLNAMKETFDLARNMGVPIVVANTADQFDTEQQLAAVVDDGFPKIRWDAATGLTAINDAGKKELTRAKVSSDDTLAFAAAMSDALKLTAKGTVIFVHNAGLQLMAQEPREVATAIQTVANLRQAFKQNNRVLVLLDRGLTVPAALEQDVFELEVPLPDATALGTMVDDLYVSAQASAVEQKVAPIPDLAPEVRTKIIEAVSGLSLFAAEQSMAMSLSETGVNVDHVWERKRVTIERAPGLSVWRGGERFSDIVGLDGLKEHLFNQIPPRARKPVGVVLFWDEIDKVFNEDETDTTGLKTDAFRTVLTTMENEEWRGVTVVGPPGTGKSLIAKAFGNEAGVPTIAVDLSAMFSKYVGESEGNIRNFVRIVKAIGNGHAYVIATSNNKTIMRPELQRRFTDGMWFVDIANDAERDAAWVFYGKRYGLDTRQANRPVDDGWTPAEVRNCCRYAWNSNVDLKKAARFILPMSRSRGEEIEALRQYGHMRFLDARHGGDFTYSEKPMVQVVAQLRSIQLPKGKGGKPTVN